MSLVDRRWFVVVVGVLGITTGLVTRPPSVGAAGCPTSVRFEPTAPGTFDVGWSGIDHGLPVFGPTLDLALTCAASEPPCGTCTIDDAIPTDDWQRCRNDTSRSCTVATEVAACGAPATCATFLSAPQSLGIGGVAFCATIELGGPVAGTVDVETGLFSPRVPTRTEVRLGELYPLLPVGSRIQGCPRCVGDPGVNDGVRGGICDEGTRAGLPCDTDAVSAYPDFGGASFDCPTDQLVVSTVTLAGPPATSGPQTITLDAGSPNCLNAAGKPCFCSTCNSAGVVPCHTNADCPASGGNPGVCNGKRCLTGSNAGAPCNVNSECPASQCGRVGEATKPNACLDDTTTANDCSPSGECTAGPSDNYCTNHPDRGCLNDSACDDVPGSCRVFPRRCFSDNGVPGGAVSVEGMSTPPVNGIAAPTDLTSLFCFPPVADHLLTGSGGFPGLARLHQPGRLIFTALGDVCPPTPAACRSPEKSGSTLQLDDRTPDAKDQLQWKWQHGAATTVPDLGSPTTTDGYALCLYDGTTVRSFEIPPGGTCAGKPCWHPKRTGFTYRNKAGGPHGILQVDLTAGRGGKARATVKGKGDLLPLPPLASLTAPVTVQLRNQTTGLCFGTTFVPPFDKLTASKLKDRAD